MNIEIKKSEKPIIYEEAKKMMEERLLDAVSYTHLTLPTTFGV